MEMKPHAFKLFIYFIQMKKCNYELTWLYLRKQQAAFH